VTTLEQTFSKFLSSLELTSAQRDAASKQHVALRENLQKHLETLESFLTGSFARRTAIRPLNDIDMFVVLDPSASAPTPPTPEALLGHLKAALAKTYPAKSVRRQTRSLNIEFSGTGIAYDIVPALPRQGGGYRIPDRDASSWIATNPKTHKRMGTEANERAGKKLIPLVKALKHANVHAGKPARSFHLEALSWTILTQKPGSWLGGLSTLVAGLERSITAPCPDPANLGPNIEPDQVRVGKSKKWLSTVRRHVDEAVRLASRGDDAGAHQQLKKVFGPQWPA